MDLRALPSLVKIAAWGATVAVVMALLQAGAWLIGSQVNVLDNGTTLLTVALLSLLLLMSIDRRPLSDYGVFVGPTWKRLALTGIGLGLATYTAYVVVALLVGAYALSFSSLTLPRLGKALAEGLTAVPLAVTQQFVFSGYLLAMLRDRCPRMVAVFLSAALFAVLNRVDNLPSFVEPQTQQLLVGLFLTASLLGVLRLLTGSILIPSGLLAGWIFVRRFASELRLLDADPQSPWYELLIPGGDARRAPLMIGLLAAGLVGCWIALRRRGEGRVPLSEQALHADFKRVFPFSHSGMLAPLDIWLGRLLAARFRVGADYLPRLAVILIASSFNTLLTLPERLLMPWFLRRREVPDPVFIVGVHRSGTTHLHNLLALDPQFCTPRAFHMMNPHGCVFSGWLLVPVLAAVLPWRRPMDNVAFSLFSAQEEEFAIAASCPQSPYWGLTFPRQWPRYERYIFPDKLPEAERGKWQRQYHRFLQKLTFWSRKRPLLKSPHNTGRIAALRRLYPAARFIHICRHPYDVYRSNMHIAREGHVVYQLQDPDPQDSYETRFLDNYHAMESAWTRESAELPAAQRVEVRFEDLERRPLEVVRSIYRQLNLPWTAEYERRVQAYLADQADYRKNRHRNLDAELKERIDRRMESFLREWGYAEETAERPERAA